MSGQRVSQDQIDDYSRDDTVQPLQDFALDLRDARIEAERLMAERDEARHLAWIDRRTALQYREELDTARARLADLHRPLHGPCCACQRCGKFYDECRCDLDEVVDELEKAKSRLALVEPVMEAAQDLLRQAREAALGGVNSDADWWICGELFRAVRAAQPEEPK